MHQGTIRGLIAAAAITATVTAVGVYQSASAGTGASASSFVPITPCRLFDTRPGDDNVGGRGAPLGPGDVHTVTATGASGHCNLPSSATAAVLNVVAINPSASSYLTVFPAGQPRPTASSLNWTAGQAPTPNAVTAALSDDGKVSFFNLAGSVDIAADVVGYYQATSAGPAGPPGPAGATGAQGPAGADAVDPARVIWVAESGGDFTSVAAALASITDNDADHRYLVQIAPGTYVENAGIDLKDHVDLQGSGPGTIIQSNGSGSNGATVRIGTVHAELRSLSIATTGSRGLDISAAGDVDDVVVRDVSITVTGSANGPRGIVLAAARATLDGVSVALDSTASEQRGIAVESGSILVASDTHVVIEPTHGGGQDCYGVRSESSTLTFTASTILIDGCTVQGNALHAWASTVTVDQVSAVADTANPAQFNGTMIGGSSTATLDRLVSRALGTGGVSGLFTPGATILLRDATLTGTSHSLYRSSGTVQVVGALMGGATFSMSGRCTDTLTYDTLAVFTCS